MEKLLKPKLADKDVTEIHAQKQIEKKKVFVGSQVLRPGHRVFEINMLTKEVKEAEYTYEAVYGKSTKKSVTTKEDHVYILALNKKNALKKYNNLLK